MWVKSEGCAFARLLSIMEKEDKEYLEQAVANGVPTSLLVKALRAEGYKTSRDSFYTHFNKACVCGK